MTYPKLEFIQGLRKGVPLNAFAYYDFRALALSHKNFDNRIGSWFLKRISSYYVICRSVARVPSNSRNRLHVLLISVSERPIIIIVIILLVSFSIVFNQTETDYRIGIQLLKNYVPRNETIISSHLVAASHFSTSLKCVMRIYLIARGFDIRCCGVPARRQYPMMNSQGVRATLRRRRRGEYGTIFHV